METEKVTLVVDPETFESRLEAVHKWRWRALTIWIVLFSLMVGYSVRSSRHSVQNAKSNSERVLDLTQENKRRIHQLTDNKAQITDLQHTNCGLEKFLLTARRARWSAYQQTHDKSDLRAVSGYEQLVEPFLGAPRATGNCPIPKRLQIKERPLRQGDH